MTVLWTTTLLLLWSTISLLYYYSTLLLLYSITLLLLYSTLLFSYLICSFLIFSTQLYSTLPYSLYSTLLYSTLLYSTLFYSLVPTAYYYFPLTTLPYIPRIKITIFHHRFLRNGTNLVVNEVFQCLQISTSHSSLLIQARPRIG